MSWKNLNTTSQLDEIVSLSESRPQIIFKHSTRCTISDMAKVRIERSISKLSPVADLYLLDLIAFRSVSDLVAERFKVRHESPQVLVISNGDCILDQSHYDVRPDEILEVLLHPSTVKP